MSNITFNRGTESITLSNVSFEDLSGSDRQEIAGQYIDTQTVYIQNQVVEYILGASVEDPENAPFCYDDITNNTPTGNIEINGVWYSLDSDERDEKLEFYEYLRDKATNVFDSAEVVHSGLVDAEKDDQADEYYERAELFQASTERYSDACDELESLDFDDYPEIYQWFLVSDNLAYHLEEQGECMIDGTYWGRTCCGQSIILDCVIQRIAFGVLKDYEG
jgi:hypothetical protein